MKERQKQQIWETSRTMTDARGKYRFLVGLSSGLIYWRELEGRNDSLDGWLNALTLIWWKH